MSHGPTPILPSRRDLHRIFREVEAETGIALRGEFACCSTCGQAALDKPEVAPGGFAFYHVQDTDYAAEHGVIYLCFHGSPEGSPPETARTQAQVARALVHALSARGLFVQWNRRTTSRITVAVDRATFDRNNVDSQRTMRDDARPTFETALDEDWYAVVWEEPEATSPDMRWRGLLVDPDYLAALCLTGETREEVETDLRKAHPEILADWEDNGLWLPPGTPVGEA